ncbi:MAG: hypothetical protein ACFFAE_13295 [Candidatus Hodarchaeota archaeon]
MAGIAHLGVGLAFKILAPEVPVLILIIGSYLLDIVFLVFMFAGLEELPQNDRVVESPWSHSLFMAVIWSVVATVVTTFIIHDLYISLIMGLLVFSHWVIDFIVSPMTYTFPNDTGKLLHPFGGSPKVGLGVMRTKIGVVLIEGGSLLLGCIIYLLTIIGQETIIW